MIRYNIVDSPNSYCELGEYLGRDNDRNFEICG
jgi:hypothetical protein